MTVQGHEFRAVSGKAILVLRMDFCIVCFATYLDLPIVPCPVWIAFNGTWKRLKIVLQLFIPPNFQVVMINHPSILVWCVGIHLISLCNDMVHQIVDVSTKKRKDEY